MKIVEIELTGVTPLLQHRMDEESLFSLLGAKSTRKQDKEELTPREIAQKHVYQSQEGKYYIPAEYVAGAFSHVASDYKQKNSTRKSLKTIAKGIFQPVDVMGVLVDESENEIKNFEVDIRKATNHQKGAVAVCRPRFDKWKSKLKFQVDESLVSLDTVHEMLNDAGKRSGIGSFRVSKGGYFGQFRITNFKVINE
jgi:hypothetical protein